VHPLRRVSERLPRVPQDRRPQLRRRVFRTDRRDDHTAPQGARKLPGPAARELTVRGLLRSVSGQDRSTQAAHRTQTPARRAEDYGLEGSAPLQALGVVAALRLDIPGRRAHPAPCTPAMAREAGSLDPSDPFSSRGWISEAPGPLRGWTAQRDFPTPTERSFRHWWSGEDRR
jgi:hypothetical protein